MSALRLRVTACLVAMATLGALTAATTWADLSQDARPVPHVVASHG